ncbi:MAG TPA: class I adenylate-forming enzyme family protein [Acidimicrobiales bacterium]|nr:class I adenylate-forming enzyme family protein [Acidimicrobiales bacterium]
MNPGGLPDIPFRPTLPELLHRAAERFGDDDFVVLWERRISFAGAERASAALAKQLLAAGVGKGTRIGIVLPTGIDWVVAWLASARIGAMPMLFPATYRPAELRRALRISDAALLFAGRTLLGKDFEAFLEEAVPGLADGHGRPLRDPEVPYLREIWMVGGSDRSWATSVEPDEPAAITDELLANVEAEVSPADPLLVIYTSGSSADPKAVVHTHGAAIRKVQAHLGMCLPGSFPGRTFCAMPFFWVGGPQELLGALHCGAAIVTQERFEVGGCLDLLERERCTSILGWATVLDQVRAHPTFPSRDLSALTLPQPGAAMVSSKGDPPNLGMTETFGPHANRAWFDYNVIDLETGDPVPDGQEGEFCVRGFGLMAGMYKKEREEVFDADGWYHTGDRGYLEDGRIWFRGRYSEVVKTGGANVSPLEVERVLGSFADVSMAFVFGMPDAARGEVVAAAVIPAKGAAIDVEDLRERVNNVLSAYKVPTRWLVLDEDDMPWLGSGKPDKRALRDL